MARQTQDIIHSLKDLMEVADMLMKSDLLPKTVKKKETAAAIILKGRELGIPMMESFALITVIAGKPTISPQGMLALIERSGQAEDMLIEDDGQECRVTMKRKGRSAHTGSFSMKDADLFMASEWENNQKITIKLSQKSNWKSQPRTMRQWRAVAATARVVYPDVIGGLYLHEEVGADVDEEGNLTENAIEHIDSEPKMQLNGQPVEQKAEEPKNVQEGQFTEQQGETKKIEPAEFKTGVLTYRKRSDGKDEVLIHRDPDDPSKDVWKPAHLNVVLTGASLEKTQQLFDNTHELVNSLKRHFKNKATIPALTWEEYAALLRAKKEQVYDPRWYADKLEEQKAEVSDEMDASYPGWREVSKLPGFPDWVKNLSKLGHPNDMAVLYAHGFELPKDWEIFVNITATVAEGLVEYDSQQFQDLIENAKSSHR